MRWCLAAVLVTSAACGAPETSKAPPETPRPAATAAFPSGVFAITSARTVSDHCDNRLRFSTERIEIDLADASVHAFPDHRAYEVVMDGKTLVARGTGARRNLCQAYETLEIWRLEAQGPDEIGGYRTTYRRDRVMRRGGDCLQACKVVYAVEAVRTPDDELEGE